MNVNSSTPTSYLMPATTVQAGSGTPSASGSPSDDEGASHRVHHGHHGGGMGHALMQAMESLGLSPSDSSSGDTSGSGTDADSSVKSDMGAFMHSLVDAVKSDSSSAGASSSGTGSGSGSPSDFASGLNALISQVANGSAPAGVQASFDKLMGDMQSTGGATATASATGSASDATGTPSVSLQQLLTQMQQNLGHDPVPSAGNLVSTTA
jgi:hypothetical protein